MSVLPYQEIFKMSGFQPTDSDDVETQTGPIRPCLKRNIRSAGYDLRLGDEYYMKTGKRVGKIRIQKLDPNTARTLVIPPNQVVIVTTKEALNLPSHLVGHLTLKLELLLRGLIMANQSQVDAGYDGGLFVLLYNLSNHDVSLQWGQSILRLELEELTSPTSRPYSTYGAFGNKSLAQVLTYSLESCLEVMRGDVERSNKRISRTQLFGATILILTTVITGGFTYFGPLATKMTQLEEKIAGIEKLHDQESSFYGNARREEIDSLKKEIVNLKQEVENIKSGRRVAK